MLSSLPVNRDDYLSPLQTLSRDADLYGPRFFPGLEDHQGLSPVGDDLSIETTDSFAVLPHFFLIHCIFIFCIIVNVLIISSFSNN